MDTSVVAGCVIAACVLVPGISPGDELPSPLTLHALVGLVEARAPQVAATRDAASAAQLRVRGVGLLDDPTLSLEWWQQPVNFSTVPLMLSLRQPLPWPGRLRAHRLVETRSAEVARAHIDEVARATVADAKLAYLDLFLATRSIGVNDKVRAILQAMVEVADAKYRVGKAAQADVLKVQADLLTLENERLDLDVRESESRAQLNALLDRPGDATLPPLADEFDETSRSMIPAQAVELAVRQQPAVVLARRELAETEARLVSARHDADPELAVWAAYMVNVRGVDTFTTGVSTTLPVFSARRRSASVSAAEAEAKARRAALRAAERRAEAEVRTILLQAEAAERHARLHADKLIPVADLALKSAEAAYQNDRIDLFAVLDAARMVRDHHLNHLRYLVEHQRRLAELERVLGPASGEVLP